MDVQFDVITTGDDTTLIQEYSPIYLNPNDIKIRDSAKGGLNLASIPSASCLSFKEISKIEADEEETEKEIDEKLHNAIDHEDYEIVKEIFDKYYPASVGMSLNLLAGYLEYAARDLKMDIEKKIKFVDFVTNYYEMDLNDKKLPVLPITLLLITSSIQSVVSPEDVWNDDMIFIAGHFIKKGARVDVDDSPLAEHLATLCIQCFLSDIEKFPMTSLERLCDAFHDLNKPFFKVYSENFTLLEYIFYLKEFLVKTKLSQDVIGIATQRGAKMPKERLSIEESKVITFLDAIEKNDLKKIRRLLRDGIDPNYLYKNLDRPIFAIVYYWDSLTPECLETLLKAGVDPNQPVDMFSQGAAMEYFILEEKTEHIKVLIKNGADINQRFYSDFYYSYSDEISSITYFEYAMKCGLYKIATLFARAKATSIHDRIGVYAQSMLSYVRSLLEEESDKDLSQELRTLEKVLEKKGVAEF